jgi:hypothetical protein
MESQRATQWRYCSFINAVGRAPSAHVLISLCFHVGFKVTASNCPASFNPTLRSLAEQVQLGVKFGTRPNHTPPSTYTCPYRPVRVDARAYQAIFGRALQGLPGPCPNHKGTLCAVGGSAFKTQAGPHNTIKDTCSFKEKETI